MKSFPDVFSIIDTETTGMRPPFSRVIDIGIIRVERGKVVDRFQSLVNPGISIPSFIRRFTNITDEDLADAPPFEGIALKVEELLKGAVFVAHNAPFDYSFVKSEFTRLDMPFSAETLCSVRLSRALYPGERSHSLESIIGRYGIKTEARHRALPDAEAVWDFFGHISSEVSPRVLKSAVERSRLHGDAPEARRLGRGSFKRLPDSAGVYLLHGQDGELLHVGKSKHVRTRARSHFNPSGGKKEERLREDAASIESIATSGELSALILESALIKSELPTYNRATRKRKKLVVAKSLRDANGYASIALERTDEVVPHTDILGVFRTTTQAKIALRSLAKSAKLCPRLLGLEKGADGTACFSLQLEDCDGACVGKASPEEYNARVNEAFASRRLRTWPYSGVVMIDEKESAEAGTVFFIDNWALLGAFRYRDEEFSPLAENLLTGLFDYDTYKPLVRYMMNPRNRRSIQVLSKTEFDRMYARCTGVSDHELESEFVIS